MGIRTPDKRTLFYFFGEYSDGPLALPVRAKKTPAALVLKAKTHLRKRHNMFEKLALRQSQK